MCGRCASDMSPAGRQRIADTVSYPVVRSLQKEAPMRTRETLLPLLIAGLAASACSKDERTVRGHLAEGQFQLRGAQAIAVDSDGSTRRAEVQANGAFKMTLPVGKTYSLALANSTDKACVYDAFAVLISRDAHGGAYARFHLTRGGEIDLGLVSAVKRQASALRIAGDDDTDDDGSDDEGDSDQDED